jgi:hypothetical protein
MWCLGVVVVAYSCYTSVPARVALACLPALSTERSTWRGPHCLRGRPHRQSVCSRRLNGRQEDGTGASVSVRVELRSTPSESVALAGLVGRWHAQAPCRQGRTALQAALPRRPPHRARPSRKRRAQYGPRPLSLPPQRPAVPPETGRAGRLECRYGAAASESLAAAQAPAAIFAQAASFLRSAQARGSAALQDCGVQHAPSSRSVGRNAAVSGESGYLVDCDMPVRRGELCLMHHSDNVFQK